MKLLVLILTLCRFLYGAENVENFSTPYKQNWSDEMTCYADLKPGDVFRLNDSKRPRMGVRMRSGYTPIIWIEKGDVEPRANIDLTILTSVDWAILDEDELLTSLGGNCA